MNKIKAIVTVNERDGYVLENRPKLIYTKHDRSTIIGTDGTFFVAYGLEFDRHAQAFAGREFKIPLDDGTVEKCTGQWWSGFTPKAMEILGEDIVSVAVSSVDELKDCYVVGGYNASSENL